MGCWSLVSSYKVMLWEVFLPCTIITGKWTALIGMLATAETLLATPTRTWIAVSDSDTVRAKSVHRVLTYRVFLLVHFINIYICIFVWLINIFVLQQKWCTSGEATPSSYGQLVVHATPAREAIFQMKSVKVWWTPQCPRVIFNCTHTLLHTPPSKLPVPAVVIGWFRRCNE